MNNNVKPAITLHQDFFYFVVPEEFVRAMFCSTKQKMLHYQSIRQKTSLEQRKDSLSFLYEKVSYEYVALIFQEKTIRTVENKVFTGNSCF